MQPRDREPSWLWVARHGETEWSASGRHTSWTDVELTEAGQDEARAMGRRLTAVQFARVFTSPRLRARTTCELAGFGARAEVLDDLVEWDYGDDEGRTTEEIRRERAGWTVWTDGPKGGEPAAEVSRRADRVIDVVRSGPGPVLAFTHGHFARVVGARWIGLHVGDGARLRLSTGSLSALGYERETPAVVHWNATSDLLD